MIKGMFEILAAVSYLGLFMLGLAFFSQVMGGGLKLAYNGYKRASASFQRRKNHERK